MPNLSSNKTIKKKLIKLRRLKNAVLILIALSIIFLAISFTLLRVAIKFIPDYSLAIQQEISKQIGMTLDIGSIDAEIYWLVPRLSLLNVNVLDGDDNHHLVHLDEIYLSLDWAESIKIMSPVVGEITLSGLNLNISINKKSELLIQNHVIKENIDGALNSAAIGNDQGAFAISDAVKDAFKRLDFKISNSKIHLFDERNKQRSKIFSNLNVHLINNGNSHILEVKAHLPHKYGRYLHFIIDMNGDVFDYKTLEGDAYLALENINVAPWLDDYWDEIKIAANANIDGRFWVSWRGKDILDITSRVNISDIALHYLDERVNTWSVNELEAKIQWQKNNDDWQLNVRELVVDREGINWLKPAAATVNVKSSEQLVQLQADFLRMEGFVYLAGMLNSAVDIDLPWLNLMEKFKPSGELKNLDVILPLDNFEDIKINTEFNQLGFKLPNMEPTEIKNLHGVVAYVDSSTWLILDSKKTEIKFNDLFRNSIYLEKLKGNLKFSYYNKTWQLSSSSLIIDTPDIQTEMRVDFSMPDEGSAFLDLTTHFKNGDAKAVSQYLPASVMGKGAVNWIDGALKEGEVIDGGYQFYGYLKDAPFRKNEGISLADFNVSGVDLNYLENWPNVNNISANLRFVNDSMLVQAEQAQLLNSNVLRTTVYIDNFISPTLDLNGDMNIELQDIKNFINGSALREDVTDYIDNLKFKGDGKLNLKLFLPLYGDYSTEVGGRLVMENGGLLFTKEKYELGDVNGEIQFAGDTVEATNLSARMLNGAAKKPLDIIIKTHKRKTEQAYRIDVKGDLLASSLLAPLPDFQSYISGVSKWDIGIDIINDTEKKSTVVKAQLTSDMQSVVSTLPGPLAKNTQQKEPAKINVAVDAKGDIDYKLVLANKDLFQVKQTNENVLIYANASSIKGNADINITENIDLPININLEYLNLNNFYKESNKEQLDNNSDDLIEAKNQQSISPRNIPSLDLRIKKLIWKQTVYNDSRLKIQNSKLGAVIEEIKLTGTDHLITGKGSWFTGKNNINTTKLDLNIKIDDLGKVFKELEISESLIAGSGNVKLRWSWQDMPYNFDWKKLQGDGQLNLKKGTLKDLDAGAGRLLGIFNFKTLLSLDFGSQMDKGFNFDKVKGTFTFSDENIYSDDFEIESKVATIFMKGKLSIANNEVDQVITVRPDLGGTVTLGATVVAGPAAGGLVYLFQKIFNTDRLSEYQYTMKGKIDKPVVQLISVPIVEEDEDNDF